ncbi:hypothetical protein D3C77_648120 [compost metagenome]
MAPASQVSAQMRHSTPRCARQSVPMRAHQGNGVRASSRSRARGWQAAAHSPHSVQPASANRMLGKPPLPALSTCCGQAFTQASQRLQRAVNSDSSTAQGGRLPGTNKPAEKNRRLDTSIWLILMIHVD